MERDKQVDDLSNHLSSLGITERHKPEADKAVPPLPEEVYTGRNVPITDPASVDPPNTVTTPPVDGKTTKGETFSNVPEPETMTGSKDPREESTGRKAPDVPVNPTASSARDSFEDESDLGPNITWEESGTNVVNMSGGTFFHGQVNPGATNIVMVESESSLASGGGGIYVGEQNVSVTTNTSKQDEPADDPIEEQKPDGVKSKSRRSTGKGKITWRQSGTVVVNTAGGSFFQGQINPGAVNIFSQGGGPVDIPDLMSAAKGKKKGNYGYSDISWIDDSSSTINLSGGNYNHVQVNPDALNVIIQDNSNQKNTK